MGVPIKWERPFIGKMREVQFAAGGRQIAPTFPLIDARFFGTPMKWERPLNVNAQSIGTPIHRERPIHRKTREVQLFRRRAENCTEFALIGTPTHRERHCIR